MFTITFTWLGVVVFAFIVSAIGIVIFHIGATWGVYEAYKCQQKSWCKEKQTDNPNNQSMQRETALQVH